jgi:FMN phosphatase YigB (HAD superfamily)
MIRSRTGFNRRAVREALLVASLATCATPASADCLRAVFFDLGETLVTAAGGGMFTLKPGAQETVDLLQARGLEIGIITNVPAGWTRADLEAILLQPEFLDEFDVLTLSSQAPASKPNPAIYTFSHAALPTPVPITACAFVGETLGEIANAQVSPTLGARSVGMIGIHLSSAAPSPLADFTVAPDALPAILAVVDTTCALLRDGFESGDASAWDSCSGCS